MKTLMDRPALLDLYTRTFARQKTVGVATSGGAPTRGVARSLADFFGQRVAILGAKTTSIERGCVKRATSACGRRPPSSDDAWSRRSVPRDADGCPLR